MAYLPQAANFVSLENSSTSPLVAGASFDGSSVSVLHYPCASVYVSTDVSGTLLVQQRDVDSDADASWTTVHFATVLASQPYAVDVPFSAEFARVTARGFKVRAFSRSTLEGERALFQPNSRKKRDARGFRCQAVPLVRKVGTEGRRVQPRGVRARQPRLPRRRGVRAPVVLPVRTPSVRGRLLPGHGACARGVREPRHRPALADGGRSVRGALVLPRRP